MKFRQGASIFTKDGKEAGRIDRVVIHPIPADTVAVREGARVITRDRRHIGNVEQVITRSMSNRATHFLVSKGLAPKEKKMVPVEWIDKFGENKVRLAAGTGVIESLPD